MFLILVAFLILLFFILCVKRILFLRKYKLPPLGNGALPIVGHTFSMLIDKEKLYNFMVNEMALDAKRKGLDAIRIQVGGWNVYVILDIQDGMTICNSCLNKDGLFTFFQPWIGKEGLITADEIIWKKHRRMLAPTFNQKILDGFLIEMNRYSKKLVEEFAPHVGREVDQLEFTKRFSFQTICATAMGANVDDEDASVKENYLRGVEQFTIGMIERSQKFWYHSELIYNFSSLKRRQDRIAKMLKEISDKVISKRKMILKTQPTLEDGSPRPKAFLDLLLALYEEGTLTNSEIREEVDTFIAAGADTTATALAYVLAVVGTYPEIQRKLFNELKEVFGESKRDVEKQDITKLIYMEAVIKETMRLYPLVMASGRRVDRDVVLKNYTIPAGSRCFPAFFAFLRDPIWGPDAEQFDPERWLDPSRLPPNHNAFYSAFGLGKRSCLGMNYSMTSMKTCLSHLLRHYEFAGDVTNITFTVDIVVKPAKGYHVSFQRRNDN